VTDSIDKSSGPFPVGAVGAEAGGTALGAEAAIEGAESCTGVGEELAAAGVAAVLVEEPATFGSTSPASSIEGLAIGDEVARGGAGDPAEAPTVGDEVAVGVAGGLVEVPAAGGADAAIDDCAVVDAAGVAGL
jgi:hypothetical protein